MTARKRNAPLVTLHDAPWFNLRAIVDYSPTAVLAMPEERTALGSFLGSYGVELPPSRSRDEDADPLAKLQAFLARPAGVNPSRFSDGSFPIVYMGDSPETGLAEISYHLGRALGETRAAKVRTHYFLLARFLLTGESLDVRKGFPALHLPDDWGPAQSFGRQARSEDRCGIIFRAVHRKESGNLAVMRQTFAKSGNRIQVVGLRWDGFGVSRI
jgi:hypothetical protein